MWPALTAPPTCTSHRGRLSTRCGLKGRGPDRAWAQRLGSDHPHVRPPNPVRETARCGLKGRGPEIVATRDDLDGTQQRHSGKIGGWERNAFDRFRFLLLYRRRKPTKHWP